MFLVRVHKDAQRDVTRPVVNDDVNVSCSTSLGEGTIQDLYSTAARVFLPLLPKRGSNSALWEDVCDFVYYVVTTVLIQ